MLIFLIFSINFSKKNKYSVFKVQICNFKLNITTNETTLLLHMILSSTTRGAIRFSRSLLCFSFFLLFFIQNTLAQNIPWNKSKTFDNFVYELFVTDEGDERGSNRTKEKASMFRNADGSFGASWSGAQNVLARKSKRPGNYNDVINFNSAIKEGTSGNSFIAAYGWFGNNSGGSIGEYYVIENWHEWRPVNGTYKNTFNSGDQTYDVYVMNKKNAPHFFGDDRIDFTQYICVNKNRRVSGTITMSDHFNQFNELGARVDLLAEVSFTCEGAIGNKYWEESSGNFWVDATISQNQGNNAGTAHFALEYGTYRMRSTWGDKYLDVDNQEWSTVKEYPSNTYGNSQNWILEHSSGNEYRIKSANGGGHLTSSADGTVRVAPLDWSWWSQIWIFENDGGNRFRIKNKWLGNYLINPNVTDGTIKVANLLQGQADSQKWYVEWVRNIGSSARKNRQTSTAGPKAKSPKSPKSNELEVYPIPSNDQLNIDLGSLKVIDNANAVIYDISGRVVKEVNNLNSLSTISIADLPLGTYMLRVVTGIEILSKQIVRSK